MGREPPLETNRPAEGHRHHTPKNRVPPVAVTSFSQVHGTTVMLIWTAGFTLNEAGVPITDYEIDLYCGTA